MGIPANNTFFRSMPFCQSVAQLLCWAVVWQNSVWQKSAYETEIYHWMPLCEKPINIQFGRMCFSRGHSDVYDKPSSGSSCKADNTQKRSCSSLAKLHSQYWWLWQIGFLQLKTCSIQRWYWYPYICCSFSENKYKISRGSIVGRSILK